MMRGGGRTKMMAKGGAMGGKKKAMMQYGGKTKKMMAKGGAAGGKKPTMMRGGGKATKGAKAGGKKMTLAQIRKMLPPNYKLVKKTA